MKQYRINPIKMSDLNHHQRKRMVGMMRCLCNKQRELREARYFNTLCLDDVVAAKRLLNGCQTSSKRKYQQILNDSQDDLANSIDDSNQIAEVVRKMKHAIWKTNLKYREFNGCITNAELVELYATEEGN